MCCVRTGCFLFVSVCFALLSSLLAQWQYTKVSQSYSHVRFSVSAPSLRNTKTLLASWCSIRHRVDGQLSILLHTITGLLRPSLTHYYGFICHLTPTPALAFTLSLVLPAFDRMWCQASPVTALAPCQ